MARGGARNRSGPQPDPNSLRSAQRRYVLTALPSAGYDGAIPEFPLPSCGVLGRDAREAKLWEWAWRTPQACAWSMAPWRWHTVAMWVRTAALCESSTASAADKNGLHRFADQIGLTPAGMRENGWRVVTEDQAAPQREERAPRSARPPARDRLRVVAGGDG